MMRRRTPSRAAWRQALAAAAVLLWTSGAAHGEELPYVSLNPGRSTLPQPNALWLTGGERLTGRAVAADSQAIEFEHAVLGRRRIARTRVAAVDLSADLPAPPPTGEATLIRTRGEPLPGELLWLDARKVGVDSLLGTIELPRDQVLRCLTGHAAQTMGDADEVRLLDGTTLRGRASVDGRQVRLAHAELGDVSLPGAVVRSVVFAGRAWFLTRAVPAWVRAAPLVAAHAPTGEAFRAARDDATGLMRLELLPGTTASYSRPDDGPAVFHAIVQPAPGSRGTVRLSLLSATHSRALATHDIRPGDAPAPFTASLPAQTRELILEAVFVEPLQLPTRVWLIEPHVSPAPPTPAP
jgi:hypothetical protein